MFTFGVSYFLCLIFFVFVGVGVFMRVCYDLCVLVVRLFREIGKWDLGGKREYKWECKQFGY